MPDLESVCESQGWIIPVGNLSIRYFAYYIILGINTPRIIALGFTLTHAAPACLVRECVGGSYCTGWSKCRSPTRSRSPTILPPHPIHVCAPETPLTLRCNRSQNPKPQTGVFEHHPYYPSHNTGITVWTAPVLGILRIILY